MLFEMDMPIQGCNPPSSGQASANHRNTPQPFSEGTEMRKGDSSASVDRQVRRYPANAVVDSCIGSLELMRKEENTSARLAQLLALEEMVKELRGLLTTEKEILAPLGSVKTSLQPMET